MSETFIEAVDQSKENYGILISGIDSMTAKKEEASQNIDNLFNEILGSSSDFGILGFQCKVLEYVSTFFTGASLLGTSDFSTIDLKSILIGSLVEEKYSGGYAGVGGDFFPDDQNDSETDFDIDLNQSILYDSQYSAGTATTVSYGTEISSILSQIRTASEGYYSYTATQRTRILEIIDDLLSYPTAIDTAISDFTALKGSVDNHLATALSLADTSVLEVPDCSSIISALNNMKGVSTSWITTLTDIRNGIEPIATYSSSTYNSTLVGYLNQLSNAITSLNESYNTGLTALSTAIRDDALECTTSYASVSGFRKHWVYWILKAVDRPQSYRMDYNGAVQAIESLNSQKVSARYSVSLVADSYVYLPTPVLTCLYLNVDTGLYEFVFTSIPCYDFIDLKIGNDAVALSKDIIVNNSEFSYNLDGIGEEVPISIRLRKVIEGVTETSEYSNTISLSNPTYTA